MIIFSVQQNLNDEKKLRHFILGVFFFFNKKKSFYIFRNFTQKKKSQASPKKRNRTSPVFTVGKRKKITVYSENIFVYMIELFSARNTTWESRVGSILLYNFPIEPHK